MTTSLEPKLEIPTVEEVETWDVDELRGWIQQIKPNILKGDDLELFKKEGIDGEAFLLSSLKFFNTTCGLSAVVSSNLKDLADEVKEEGKFIPRT
jgi:hypothetical protein